MKSGFEENLVRPETESAEGEGPNKIMVKQCYSKSLEFLIDISNADKALVLGLITKHLK